MKTDAARNEAARLKGIADQIMVRVMNVHYLAVFFLIILASDGEPNAGCVLVTGKTRQIR